MSPDVNNPYDYSDRIRKQLTEEIPQLDNEADRQLISDYLRHVQSEEGTLYNNAARVLTLGQELEGAFVDATALDVNNAIDEMADDRDWNNGTKRNYSKAARAVVKKTQKATPREYNINLETEYIALDSDDRNGKIGEEDVFGEEERDILIQECARNDRDKVMFALLFDMGFRIAALSTLRVGDVNFLSDRGVYRIRLNSDASALKGADGTVQVSTWSTGYLRRYLSGSHPRPNDAEAPLLHRTESHGVESDGSMSPEVLRKRIYRLVRDHDDIDESKVSPHVFRHSAITMWAKSGMTDRMITHRAGWARESGQLERYEHLSDTERNNEILENFGLEQDDDEAIHELEACPGCGVTLNPSAEYCPNCGNAIAIHVAEPDWFKLLQRHDEEAADAILRMVDGEIPPTFDQLPLEAYQRFHSDYLSEL